MYEQYEDSDTTTNPPLSILGDRPPSDIRSITGVDVPASALSRLGCTHFPVGWSYAHADDDLVSIPKSLLEHGAQNVRTHNERLEWLVLVALVHQFQQVDGR